MRRFRKRKQGVKERIRFNRPPWLEDEDMPPMLCGEDVDMGACDGWMVGAIGPAKES